jgi:hypothetical protein
MFYSKYVVYFHISQPLLVAQRKDEAAFEALLLETKQFAERRVLKGAVDGGVG